VIVTDVMLFGSRDGLALTRRVREDNRTHDVGVIILTGLGRPADRDEATRAGCDVFLMKPCMPDELAKQVRELISAKRAARGGAPLA
jgi:DNA-binding response OmpR family regulator